MRLSTFNARIRCKELIKRYGMEHQEHGGCLHWVRFPGERKGAFKRGYLALYAYLQAECESREAPKKKRKPYRYRKKPGRRRQLVVGAIAEVEVPQKSGRWFEAEIVQRDPFRSRVIEPGPFFGHISKEYPRLIARKEASHVPVQQARTNEAPRHRRPETDVAPQGAPPVASRGAEVLSRDAAAAV